MKTVLLALALLVAPMPALAHGGGLDANGGDHDRRHGGYHCHREPWFSRERARREQEEPPPTPEQRQRREPRPA